MHRSSMRALFCAVLIVAAACADAELALKGAAEARQCCCTSAAANHFSHSWRCFSGEHCTAVAAGANEGVTIGRQAVNIRSFQCACRL
jgi:hypothetical protein